jgi:hypothetical protein
MKRREFLQLCAAGAAAVLVSSEIVGGDPMAARSLAGSGAGVGELCYPRSFAFDRSGRLWIADTLDHRVQEFDGFGVSLSCIGGLGSELGSFTGPTALAFASAAELRRPLER